MTARSSWIGRARVALAALALVPLLGACATVNGMAKTQDALSAAGYRSPKVGFETAGNATVLRVRYRTVARDVAALGVEYDDIARVVWVSAPISFDRIKISASDAPGPCAGDCQDSFNRVDLVARLGARDPGLDRDTQRELVGVSLGVVTALVGGVALGLFLILRSQRRRRRADPWMYSPRGWATPPGSAPPGSAPPLFPAAPESPVARSNVTTSWGPPAGGAIPAPAPSLAPGAAQWPPATPPPPYEAAAAPPPDPTHDIWARPPS